MTVVARGPVGRRAPVAATAAALLATLSLGGVVLVSMRTEPQAARPFHTEPQAATAATAAPPGRPIERPDAGRSTALQAPAATPAPPPPRPVAAAPAPAGAFPDRRDEPPYRYFGRSSQGGESAIVLSGRGRVVTLSGPGPLDDEYRVEAVFADYLVLRHGPTGRGSFVPLGQRRAVTEPLPGPEDSAQD